MNLETISVCVHQIAFRQASLFHPLLLHLQYRDSNSDLLRRTVVKIALEGSLERSILTNISFPPTHTMSVR